MSKAWSDLWRQGDADAEREIAAYRKRYELARGAREDISREVSGSYGKTKNRNFVVLHSDNAELNPSVADVCWIECGKNTANGRQLGFKAEQGLFFGLARREGRSRIFRFRHSGGTVADLEMTFRGNQMWRLTLTNEIPEVRTGPRPILESGKFGRSPYVAVIGRTAAANEFTLRFILLESEEFRALEKETLKRGTLGKTAARRYGWCQDTGGLANAT